MILDTVFSTSKLPEILKTMFLGRRIGLTGFLIGLTGFLIEPTIFPIWLTGFPIGLTNFSVCKIELGGKDTFAA